MPDTLRALCLLARAPRLDAARLRDCVAATGSIDALVAQGIADAGDRDRLKSLQAVLAALRSRGGEPPH